MLLKIETHMVVERSVHLFLENGVLLKFGHWLHPKYGLATSVHNQIFNSPVDSIPLHFSICDTPVVKCVVFPHNFFFYGQCWYRSDDMYKNQQQGQCCLAYGRGYVDLLMDGSSFGEAALLWNADITRWLLLMACTPNKRTLTPITHDGGVQRPQPLQKHEATWKHNPPGFLPEEAKRVRLMIHSLHACVGRVVWSILHP